MYLHKINEVMILKTIFINIFTFILIFLLTGCEFTSDPQQIVAKSNTITLQWDPPDFSGNTSIYSIESYKIYYRIHNADYWLMLDEIPAQTPPTYTLNHDDFGDGMYDFAVKAVNNKGEESSFHTSEDQNTSPFGGWYLLWIKSE